MAGFATEDPKLQLMIQAQLDGQGFKDAQAGIAGLETSAAAATPAIEGTEVAVSGLSAAIIPLTLGIAVILPLLIQWLKSTTDLTEGQKELAKAIETEYKFLAPFIDKLKGVNAEFDKMAGEAQKRLLRKQIEDINLAGDEVLRLTDLLETMRKDDAFAEQFGSLGFPAEEIRKVADALDEMKTHQTLLIEAQHKGLTEQAFLAEATKGATAAIKHQGDVEGDVTADYQRNINIRSKLADKKEREDRKRAADFATMQDKEVLAMDKAEKLERAILLKKGINEKQLDEGRRARSQADLEMRAATNAATIGYIGQTASALSEAFGHNKALAIAGAIADTWAGAAAALGPKGPPWPANIAAAASIAAAGLAMVINIKKAEPGFDDPMSDMIASKLGRKSAADFVRLFGSGFHSGLTGMNGGGGTTNNTTINRGMSIQSMHMSGILAGTEKQMLVKLNRQLTTVAARHEARTTIGR